MVKLIKEVNGSGKELNLSRILPAMDWLPADAVVTGFTNGYAYTKRFGKWVVIVDVYDSGSIGIQEYECSLPILEHMFEEDLLQFGYYPKGLHSIDETVSFNYNGKDVDISVRISSDLQASVVLKYLLEQYYN